MSQTAISTEPPAAPQPLPAYTIETWPIDRPKAYERNARKHSQKQVDQLRSSFRQFGQVWPILVREDETVIAGHGRLEAARQEAYPEIRVIVARGWTENQCRAFGLLDNKVALNSEWDEKLLGLEIVELHNLGLDIEALGFEPGEVAGFTDVRPEGNTDPDDAPNLSESPAVTAPGDLWILGRHRIICGDSTRAADVERVLEGVKPNLMVTDPPYGVKYDPSWREKAGVGSADQAQGKVLNDDRADWREAWALFPGNVAYVWHGGLHSPIVAQSLMASGFNIRAQIIWVKKKHAMSRGHYHWQHEPAFYAQKQDTEDNWRFVEEHDVAAYSVRDNATGSWTGGRKQSTVWEIDHIKNDTGHGTQKPVACMKRPIENNSQPGEAIYEPFSGSGTTIIAAEMSGRSCHAVELSPAYVDVAVKRWEAFTGLVATLSGDGRSFAEVAAVRMPAPPAVPEQHVA